MKLTPSAYSFRSRVLGLALAFFSALTLSHGAILKGVQSGTAIMNNSADTTTILMIAITPVDTAKAFLLFQIRSAGDRPVHCELRGRLASPDSLQFVRRSNEGSPGVAMNIQWYVVEFNSGVNVQRGEVSQSSTTVNVTLPTALTAVNQAFVTWSKTPLATDGTFDTNDPVVGEITSATNLQFRVDTPTAGHTIWWQVIEYTNASDINVRKVTLALPGAALGSTTLLGTPVDTAATFILAGYRTNGSGTDVGAKMIRARLVNPTTITVDRSVAGDADNITEVLCQVVELKDGTKVQRGSGNFPAGVSQVSVPIGSVSLSRAVTFASVQSGGGQNLGRSPYVADDSLGAGTATLALSSTQLTLDRNSTAASADIGWFVVEFPTGPVPVQLASFRGIVTAARTVVLEWSTVSEVNNYGFTVERRLEGNGEFRQLPNSFVPGHGTTLQPQHYSFTDAVAAEGVRFYRLRQIDLDGSIHYSEPIHVDLVTGVEEHSIPSEFALEQNFPNPFNPTTVVSYQLPVPSYVTLKVYNLLGQEMLTLLDGREEAGHKALTLDASSLPSGVYLYRLSAGTFSETKMLTLLR